MKKALIISTIIFIVSIIAFGISVAATGLREGNFAVAIGLDKLFDDGFTLAPPVDNTTEKTQHHFDSAEEVNDIEIDVLSAKTEIVIDDTETVTVDYTGGTGTELYTAIEGDKLVVKETSDFVMNIINWDIGDNSANLTITLPRKEYDDVTLNIASGTTDITDLICDKFDANSASGDMQYRIFANDIKISTLSGCVELTNCTDRKASSLKMTSTSGDHSVSGFMTDKFALESMSGCISADGISGEGDVDITSGEIDLVYAQWDNELDIDAVSGSIDVTLPADSGVTVELSSVSGSVEVLLGGKTEIEVNGETNAATGATQVTLSGDSNSGVIGGSNVHAVEVDLVSGDVDIHN